MMKFFILAIALIVVSIAITGTRDHSSSTIEASAPQVPVGKVDKEQTDWQSQTVTSLASEQRTVEVMFTDPSSLWISMVDDGSKREGFAQYACVVAQQSGMPSGEFFVISIWDAKAMAQDEMKRIGRYDCALK